MKIASRMLKVLLTQKTRVNGPPFTSPRLALTPPPARSFFSVASKRGGFAPQKVWDGLTLTLADVGFFLPRPWLWLLHADLARRWIFFGGGDLRPWLWLWHARCNLSLSLFFYNKDDNQIFARAFFIIIVFIAMTLISSFRVSMTCFQSSLGHCSWEERKTCQLKMCGISTAVHTPVFGHDIAASYKKSAAHPSESARVRHVCL